MTPNYNVLIVDANRTSLALLDMMVRKLPNFSTRLHSDPMMLLSGIGEVDYDLAIFAEAMPQIDGVELARRMRAVPRLAAKPIVLAAGESAGWAEDAARQAGVADVLHRPIDPVELRARISRLAQSVGQRAEGGLERAFASHASEMAQHEEEYFTILSRIAGFRDRETGLHNLRMGRYCAVIAHQLGLPRDTCRALRLAAGLHDIGKAGLPDSLLSKRGTLTHEERRLMEDHTRIGHDMLCSAQSPLFRLAADIALNHHERWDGTGYPRRLKGEKIPLAGRIAAVADVFDALTSIKPYKTAWSRDNALRYLQENAGEQFDPACVAAFETGQEEIAALLLAMPDLDDTGLDAA